MLKKLFYASASILMLAFAYHLGATTATAQAPASMEAPQVAFSQGSYTTYLSYVSGRTYNWTALRGGGQGYPLTFDAPRVVGGPVPGSAPVAATYTSDYTNVVLLANGDLYGCYPGASSWSYAGNLFAGGPTPAAQQTFGQLKAQYRK